MEIEGLAGKEGSFVGEMWKAILVALNCIKSNLLLKACDRLNGFAGDLP